MVFMEVREINHRLGRYNRALGNGLRIEVLEYLQQKEEAYLSELAEEFDRHTSTMSDHLTKMADYDILRGETRGRKRFFWIKRPKLVDAYLSLRELLGRDHDGIDRDTS
jgi:predicted transcriptional regulator